MYFLTFKIRLAARIDGVRTACLAPLLAAGCPAVTVGWSSPRPQHQQHGSMRAQLCLALYGPWTVARQAPLSVEPYNQEYWSGLPLPTPRDLPNPGIKPRSPTLQEDSSPSESPGNLTSLMAYWGVVVTGRSIKTETDTQTHKEPNPFL